MIRQFFLKVFSKLGGGVGRKGKAEEELIRVFSKDGTKNGVPFEVGVAYRLGIVWADHHPKCPWHRFSDEKPRIGQWVVFSYYNEASAQPKYDMGNNTDEYFRYFGHRIPGVWMNIPEPPMEIMNHSTTAGQIEDSYAEEEE